MSYMHRFCRAVVSVCAAGFLASCSPAVGTQVAASAFGSALGLGAGSVLSGSQTAGGGVSGSAKLPNTKACRDYLRYVRVAASMSQTIQKYNACLNSAPNSAAARKYRCKPGTYASYIDGVKQCRKK